MLLQKPTSWSEVMKLREFGAIADWFIFWFFWIGFFGILLAGVAACGQDWRTGLRVLVLGLLFAAATTVSGWLLGLLFGIPRSLARANLPASPAAAGGAGGAAGSPLAVGPSSRVNTNLEDISDWLTKTIVGVGLTQLLAAPHYLWHAAQQLNEKGFNWTQGGQLLALSLFFYFAPGGFWLGYVGTRTILTKLLELIDEVPEEVLNTAGKPDNLVLKDAGAGIAGPSDPQVANADQAILAKTLQQLTTTREIATWGAAQARAGNLQAAQSALADALRAEPNNSEVKELAAIVYSALGQHAEASQLLQSLPQIDLTVFNALYQPPPAGFTTAITVGEGLLTRSEQQNNPNLRVWMACAYGQKYRYERDTNHASQEILGPIKENVLREIRAALAADPNTRELLRSLWRPVPPDSPENDLAAFAPDDPDLTGLLGGP